MSGFSKARDIAARNSGVDGWRLHDLRRTWAITGCLEWQQYGLNPPQAVSDATNEYLAEEDALSTWIEEWCHTGPHHSAAPRDLFNCWRHYAQEAGEIVGTEKAFSQGLVERDFERKRSHGTRRFLGIAPKPEYERIL